MSQGSWLGTLVFLVIIGDLKPGKMTHVIQLSQKLSRNGKPVKLSLLDELMSWFCDTRMNVNFLTFFVEFTEL